ncbi:MAG: hypothetical protein RL217_2165 [Pseudomonadota bacterium]|jgi:UDP-N-acetylglucosamine--N-acetylmuramyl-(pentapeptide) pyrophosphoryl-undecaprenol N-acetylglucosamine transferase
MAELKRIVIMAGGTGGHVFPALAVAKELHAQGVEVHWLGTLKGIENELVPKAGFDLHYLDISGVRGKGLLGKVAAPLRILRAIHQARKIFKKIQPQAVLGFGGYATGPGGVATKLCSVPLFIHEQNAVAGLTNKLLAPLSQVVMQAFPNALPKALTVGNPVRAEVASLPAPQQRYGDNVDKKTPLNILVVGGSLGAQALNKAVLEAMQLLPAHERPFLCHQVGKQNFAEVKAAYLQAEIKAEVVPFIEDMAAAYQRAELVLCRAGALTVSEIAAAGCAALFVPFPFAVDDHQTANAQFLVQQQAALLQPQQQLSAAYLAETWRHYALHREKLLQMATQARALAQTQATTAVLQQIKRYYRG